MLRSLVLILLLVNAAFFAWSQGWLNDMVGVKPDAQREPQRLNQQVNPEKIVVAPRATAIALGQDQGTDSTPAAAQEANAPASSGAESAASAVSASTSPEASSTAGATTAAAPSAASAPEPVAPQPGQQPAPTPAAKAATSVATAASKPGKGICIEAGPFTSAEYASAEAMLRPLLPAGIWTRQTVAIQGMWLVYMGPYPEADQLQRKQDELKRIKDLDFEVVRTPANLAPGISLGRFSKQENAENQLETLRNKGIRTARIVNLRPAMELQLLRVPRADVDTQVKLSSIKLPQGKGFTACRR